MVNDRNYPAHLKRVPIQADGNCLYRALARSVDQDENQFQKYREMAASHIEKNPNEVNDKIEETLEQYVNGIRNEAYGGEIEILAIARELKRRVIVYRTNSPNTSTYCAEELHVFTILLFKPMNLGHPDKDGHYDLLVESVTSGDVPLDKLIKRLKRNEQQLKDSTPKFSSLLQTSFLKIENILRINFGAIGREAPEFENILEIIAEIARKDNWFQSDGALYLIYDVLCDIQSGEVCGDPTQNFFRVLFTSPGVFFLHCMAWLVYSPLCTLLMVLLMLGKIHGWFALVIGFASATMAALPSENNKVAEASRYFAIFTGILAAAKGINLESEYLYPRFEDLTVEILRRAFGIEYSKEAVFQYVFDNKSFTRFATILRVKKADIRKVQDVRMFLSIVTSTSLVINGKNYSEIVKLSNILYRIESVLLDLYNYLTLQDLESNHDTEQRFGFKNWHVNEVKAYYNQITPVKSFCVFLKELNTEKMLPLCENQQAAENTKSATTGSPPSHPVDEEAPN